MAVSADWRLEFANRAARSMLDEADALRLAEGRIEFLRDADRSRATRWLSEGDTTSSGVRALTVPRASGRLPYVLHRVAWDGVAERAETLFGVLLTDPAKPPAVEAEVLIGVFGFTPSEAAIAAALAKGQSIEAIARKRNISLSTARRHLESAFAKGGCSRQSDLVRAVLLAATSYAMP